MLIPSRQRRFTDSTIFFPDFLRAPLGMREGSLVYSVVDKKLNQRSRCIEITSSTIAPSLWDQIWRIEITTEDAVGNTLLMIEVLESYSIDILSIESSINWNPQYHTTNIVVSTRGYESDIDGTPETRIRSELQNLKWVESELIATLAEHMAVPRYKSQPLIKIKRSNSYRRLSDCGVNDQSSIINKNGIKIQNSGIRLPNKILIHCSNLLGCANLAYFSSTDTKTKLIRTMMYASEGPSEKVSLCIFSHRNGPLKFSPLYSLIRECGMNIVQQQIRKATSAEYQKCTKDHNYDVDRFEGGLRRLDFLVEIDLFGDASETENIWHRLNNLKNDLESQSKNDWFVVFDIANIWG